MSLRIIASNKIRLARSLMTAKSLSEWAEDEIVRSGLMDPTSDYGGDVGNCLLTLIRIFADQGHSGFSAGMTSLILNKLMNYEPISPIMNPMIDREYTEYQEGELQSNVDFKLFSSDNGNTWYRLIDIPILEVVENDVSLADFVKKSTIPVEFGEDGLEIGHGARGIDWSLVAGELWLLLDEIESSGDLSLLDRRHEFMTRQDDQLVPNTQGHSDV